MVFMKAYTCHSHSDRLKNWIATFLSNLKERLQRDQSSLGIAFAAKLCIRLTMNDYDGHPASRKI